MVHSASSARADFLARIYRRIDESADFTQSTYETIWKSQRQKYFIKAREPGQFLCVPTA